jgi:hypothetical protein
MKEKQIKEIAISKGITVGTMKKTELIRAIQRQEGNQECFGGSEQAEKCGQMQCLWRKDCLAM